MARAPSAYVPVSSFASPHHSPRLVSSSSPVFSGVGFSLRLVPYRLSRAVRACGCLTVGSVARACLGHGMLFVPGHHRPSVEPPI